MKKEIDLSPSTIGQFKVGDPYEERGRVIEVKLTSMAVEYPDNEEHPLIVRSGGGCGSGVVGLIDKTPC